MGDTTYSIDFGYHTSDETTAKTVHIGYNNREFRIGAQTRKGTVPKRKIACPIDTLTSDMATIADTFAAAIFSDATAKSAIATVSKSISKSTIKECCTALKAPFVLRTVDMGGATAFGAGFHYMFLALLGIRTHLASSDVEVSPL